MSIISIPAMRLVFVVDADDDGRMEEREPPVPIPLLFFTLLELLLDPAELPLPNVPLPPAPPWLVPPPVPLPLRSDRLNTSRSKQTK